MEAAGFILALLAYLLPFITYDSLVGDPITKSGVVVAAGSLLYLLTPYWYVGVILLGAVALPMLAAIAGLAFSSSTGWKSAIARMAFGAAGLMSLMWGNLLQSPFGGLGHSMATGAFAIAAAGAGIRLLGLTSAGQGPAQAPSRVGGPDKAPRR